MESAYFEKLGGRLARQFRDNRTTFLAGLLSGLAAYGFAFSNKLVNLDEIHYLFSLGESFSSGRWGLGLLSPIFPSVSVPWIYGLLSVLVLSAASCVLVRIFSIEDGFPAALTAALMLCFPVQTQTFAYMFTALPYALAVLFTLASLRHLLCGEKTGRDFALSAVFLCLMLSIYQAYIGLYLALTLVYLIMLCFGGSSGKDIIRLGLLALLSALVSGLAYLLVNRLMQLIFGIGSNGYVSETVELSIPGIAAGIKNAYVSFFYYFRYRLYGVVPTDISMLAHALLLGFTAFVFAVKLVKCRDALKRCLLLICAVLLPLAVNCMFAVSKSRHGLMAYGFVSVYVLAAVSARSFEGKIKRALRSGIFLLLAVIAVNNVFFANSISLKQKLEYEGAYSYYQLLASRVKALPGYDEDTEIVLCGEANEGVYTVHEIETGNIMAVGNNILNVYSRDDFIRYYIGLSNPVTDDTSGLSTEEISLLNGMKPYPYGDSIRLSEKRILVKLG